MANFHISHTKQFNELTKNIDNYLESNEDLQNKIKSSLKSIYDHTKSEEVKKVKFNNALPELIVDGFDLEQIWQEIELQNESILTKSLMGVSKLIVGKNGLVFNHLASKINNETEECDENNQNEEETNEINDDEDNLDVSSENNSEDDEENTLNEPTNSKKGKRSIVDDDFFKLDEMEKFLESEEKKMNDSDSGNDSEEDDDESNEDKESIDLFEANESDDEEDKVKIAKYKDFFVRQDEEPSKKSKRNKMMEEIEAENASDDGEDDDAYNKSTFELRQERLNRKIDELEQEAIAEKPWQLKGEVTSEKRPINSLLEEVVEFDLTTRPAPVITEKTTMQLEDIIRQRIKDRVFDSVERKAKPVDTPLEYKKKLLLDQEKSKESLAQIYEKEYLTQKAALEENDVEKDEEQPEVHKEIDKMMTSLFHKLDSLSNFHFTPKPSVPELKIVSNLPAISMEEVQPVAVSDATLLAPEEVKNKTKGDEIGKNERSETDKKRERRKKKIKQKVHAKLKLKKDMEKSKKATMGNKYTKEKMKKALEAVTKDRNVDRMEEKSDGKNVRSSSAFFTNLEEQVKSQIKSKTGEVKKKKKNLIDAKKMKL